MNIIFADPTNRTISFEKKEYRVYIMMPPDLKGFQCSSCHKCIHDKEFFILRCHPEEKMSDERLADVDFIKNHAICMTCVKADQKNVDRK